MRAVVLILCAAQGGQCFYCDCEFAGPIRQQRAKQRSAQWTRDHLWPRSAGGGNPYNLVLACARCNGRKRDRYPTEREIAKAKHVYAIADMLGRALLGSDWNWNDFGETITAAPPVIEAQRRANGAKVPTEIAITA